MAAPQRDAMAMTKQTSGFLVLGLLLATGAVCAEPPTRFSGDTSMRTAVFDMDGPWLLDWSTRSDNGLPALVEIRLYGDGGKQFIGTIAQLQGVGRGLKLFEDTGALQIEVVAQNVVWELLIRPVSDAVAGRISRAADGTPSLGDAAARAMRQVAEGSFESWRAVDDKTLLLFSADRTTGFRVSFELACNGLSEATALSFVTGSGAGLDAYDSILLDDGTRCYFERVSPTVFD